MGDLSTDAEILDEMDQVTSTRIAPTPFGFLPISVENKLKIYLDLTKDWQLIAERLGFTLPQILHWKERGESECLLRECCGGKVYLEDFIEAVRVIGNIPALDLLQSSYPEIREMYIRDRAVRDRAVALQVNAVGTTQPSIDSSYQTDSKPVSPQDVKLRSPKATRFSSGHAFRGTVSPPFSHHEHQKIQRSLQQLHLRSEESSVSSIDSTGVQGTRSLGETCTTLSAKGKSSGATVGSSRESEREGEETERSGGASGGKLQHAQSVQNRIQRAPFSQSQRHVQVFLTYSCHSKRQMKPVFNLFKCLKENQFSVSHEESDTRNLAQDRLGWLDKRFRSVDYILVLITPEYLEDVSCVNFDPLVDQSSVFLVDPTDRALNARYIYKLMQAEYFLNHCVNKRFIPVIMPPSKDSANQAAARDRNQVPQWLRCGCVYWWPKDYKNLFWYMIDAKNVIKNLIGDKSPNEQAITISRT